MIYSKDNLRQIFQQPFNAHEWQQMLKHYFQATELKAEPERIDGTPEDNQGFYLGAIDTTDSYRIGLFYYQIQHGNVARKRVGLRNLVKSFVNPNWGEFDAALVVFDSGELWRLSFVSDIMPSLWKRSPKSSSMNTVSIMPTSWSISRANAM